MGKKIKTSIALDEDLLKWVDKRIKNKTFANRTHAIEYALQTIMEKIQMVEALTTSPIPDLSKRIEELLGLRK